MARRFDGEGSGAAAESLLAGPTLGRVSSIPPPMKPPVPRIRRSMFPSAVAPAEPSPPTVTRLPPPSLPPKAMPLPPMRAPLHSDSGVTLRRPAPEIDEPTAAVSLEKLRALDEAASVTGFYQGHEETAPREERPELPLATNDDESTCLLDRSAIGANNDESTAQISSFSEESTRLYDRSAQPDEPEPDFEASTRLVRDEHVRSVPAPHRSPLELQPSPPLQDGPVFHEAPRAPQDSIESIALSSADLMSVQSEELAQLNRDAAPQASMRFDFADSVSRPELEFLPRSLEMDPSRPFDDSMRRPQLPLDLQQDSSDFHEAAPLEPAAQRLPPPAPPPPSGRPPPVAPIAWARRERKPSLPSPAPVPQAPANPRIAGKQRKLAGPLRPKKESSIEGPAEALLGAAFSSAVGDAPPPDAFAQGAPTHEPSYDSFQRGPEPNAQAAFPPPESAPNYAAPPEFSSRPDYSALPYRQGEPEYPEPAPDDELSGSHEFALPAGGLFPKDTLGPGASPRRSEVPVYPAHGPQQDAYVPPQDEYAPQGGYAQDAYVPPQDEYAPQGGYAQDAYVPPQDEYAPQNGYAPQGGYAPQEQYASPQGGYAPQNDGYAPSPQDGYVEEPNAQGYSAGNDYGDRALPPPAEAPRFVAEESSEEAYFPQPRQTANAQPSDAPKGYMPYGSAAPNAFDANAGPPSLPDYDEPPASDLPDARGYAAGRLDPYAPSPEWGAGKHVESSYREFSRKGGSAEASFVEGNKFIDESLSTSGSKVFDSMTGERPLVSTGARQAYEELGPTSSGPISRGSDSFPAAEQSGISQQFQSLPMLPTASELLAKAKERERGALGTPGLPPPAPTPEVAAAAPAPPRSKVLLIAYSAVFGCVALLAIVHFNKNDDPPPAPPTVATAAQPVVSAPQPQQPQVPPGYPAYPPGVAYPQQGYPQQAGYPPAGYPAYPPGYPGYPPPVYAAPSAVAPTPAPEEPSAKPAAAPAPAPRPRSQGAQSTPRTPKPPSAPAAEDRPPPSNDKPANKPAARPRGGDLLDDAL